MKKKKAIKAVSGIELREKSRPLITNPETGNSYRVRMPDIGDVIKTGVLPNNFTAKTLERLGKIEEGDLTDQHLLDNEDIRRANVTAALLEPRVTEKYSDPPDPLEIEYKDIPPADRAYIHAWVMRLVPAFPVELETGGQVSVATLESFPSDEQSGEPSGVSSGGRGGGREAVSAVGDS
ncbi:MAG TPA: hypothetical protein VF791_04170 [Pyrinomonadaceae bacterium]